MKQHSRGTKKRTCYEKSVHKAIQNVTSNNDKLRKISIIRRNNISNSKSMSVHMQRINVIDISKSKQMTIEEEKCTKSVNVHMQQMNVTGIVKSVQMSKK